MTEYQVLRHRLASQCSSYQVQARICSARRSGLRDSTRSARRSGLRDSTLPSRSDSAKLVPSTVLVCVGAVMAEPLGCSSNGAPMPAEACKREALEPSLRALHWPATA